ncbi:MAG: mannose-6-phosphate isomerase-like protein (cupin superfamily) [Salinirussus sp.]|jgi:mannose-6-phosphate isomerase-like protein (cupin superfamily)
MERVSVDEVGSNPNPRGIHDVRRPISEAVGAEHLAINYFRLEPGEAFSPGLHRHHDQEEVFYIVSGRAEFTVGTQRDVVTVGAGEAIRFAPGEFQTGHVPEDADEEVVSLAIGAPGGKHNWGEDLESLAHCRACETELPHESTPTGDGDGFRLTCTECGTAFTVR